MTRIIVDSTCDYTKEQAEEAGITMLPLKVRFGNKEYLDKFTITNEEFYKKLSQSEELPKTALVSVGEFYDEYEKYPDDDIIVITIASKMSGTWQSAVSAKNLTKRDNIYVIDSKSASLGITLIVDKAIELAASYPADKVAEMLSGYVERVRIVGIIDTLKYLVKGGRLSAFEGSVGGLLGIKPLLLIKHGGIETLARARGSKAAFDKLDEIIRTKFKIDRKEQIIIGHADNEGGIAKIKKIIGETKNSKIITIGSVVGTHTGPGVICIAFFEHSIVGAKII